MAHIQKSPTPIYHDKIYQIETDELATGGPNGNINIAPRQLAENIDYVKVKSEKAETQLQAQINSVGGGKYAYRTYDEMVADAENLPANSSIDVLNDTTDKNGGYLFDGMEFAKSAYDSTRSASIYASESASLNNNLYNDPHHYNPDKYWLTGGGYDVIQNEGRRLLKLNAGRWDYGRTFLPSEFPSNRISIYIKVESKTQATKSGGDNLFYLMQFNQEDSVDSSAEVAREIYKLSSEAITSPTVIAFENIEIHSDTLQIRLFHRSTDMTETYISDIYIGDSYKAVYHNNAILDYAPIVPLSNLNSDFLANNAVVSDCPFKGQVVKKDIEYGKFLTASNHSIPLTLNKLDLNGWCSVFNPLKSTLSANGSVDKVLDENDGKYFESVYDSAAGLIDRDSINLYNIASYAKNTNKLDLGDVDYFNLPNAAGSAAPYQGFVCTGIDRDTNGYWIVGNDGRGEGAPDVSSVVVLTHDFSTVVEEYLIRGDGGLSAQTWGSVQGVAWDSSDDTIWVADTVGKCLLHINRQTGQLIDDAIQLDFKPNGLAYDSKHDGLWVNNQKESLVRFYSCADGSLIKTIPFQYDADQLYLDKQSRILYCTYGYSSNCRITAINVETEQKIQSVDSIKINGVNAVEGIYFTEKHLYIANDGGFHKNAHPPLNRIHRYSYKNRPFLRMSRKVGVSIVYQNTNPENKSVALISIGEPTVKDGFACYITSESDTHFRIQARDANKLASLDFASNSITNKKWHCVTFHVDFDASSFVAYVDGKAVDITTDANTLNNFRKPIDINSLNVGGFTVSSSGNSRQFLGRIASCIIFDDESDINTVDEYHNNRYLTAIL